MPLYKRQEFRTEKPPPDLKEDEEVFFCPLTKEIFRDYESFFQRVILCNSLVWTCSITGRAGLTYEEAQECEEKALKQLSALPLSLQRPILLLATLTHRTRLSDLDDDIFLFVKDRYFVGETVDIVEDGEKKLATVLKVMPPVEEKSRTPSIIVLDSDDDEVISVKDGEDEELEAVYRHKYEVQEVKTAKVHFLDWDCISRKKGLFSRDKSKLYLKSHCEPRDGIWKVKDKYIKKHKLSDLDLVTFYPTMPEFERSEVKPRKSIQKPHTEDELLKKAKQELKEKKEKAKKEKETEEKKKKGETEMNVKKVTPEEIAALKEKLRLEKETEKAARLAEKLKLIEEGKKKREEEKQRMKEEREKEREKIKEEKKLHAELMKEWSKLRDDMDCDDLKPLPDFKPVRSRISNDLFGDAMTVLEFLNNFGEICDMENEFPTGYSLDMLEKALSESSAEGYLADLLIVLLKTIFRIQEEEEEEEIEIEKEEETVDLPDEDRVETYQELVHSATVMAQLPQLCHGVPLSKLHLDSYTLTEVLRLHFLSSGAKCNASNTRFRYQQRGAYTALDDAGLEFRQQETGVLKILTERNVFDLQPGDKLKVVNALIGQLLTYACSRDCIEENLEKLKQARNELRHLQWGEHRREKEEATARHKKKLEERARQREMYAEKKAKEKKEREDRLKKDEGTTVPDSKDDGNGTVEAPIEVDEPIKEGTDEAKKQDETPDNKNEDDKGSKKKGKSKKGKKGQKPEENEEEKVEEKEDTIDETKLSPEEREELKQRLAEEEARKKEEFYEKEKKLMEEVMSLQSSGAIYPLGRDRAYRRYWMFKTISGIFIEDEDEDIPEECLEPVKQLPQSVTEDKNTTSDKENESFEQPKCTVSTSRSDNPLCSDMNSTNNIAADTQENIAADKQEDGANNLMKDIDMKEVDMDNTLTKTHILEPRPIVPQYTSKWCYLHSENDLNVLLESLNQRGYREGALKTALLESKPVVLDSLKSCPVDSLNIENLTEDSDEKKPPKIQNVKSFIKNRTAMVKNKSAQELLELNLREQLLYMEEQIFAGSLGSLKVKGRQEWRDALEQGNYDMQSDHITLTGRTSPLLPKLSGVNESSEDSDTDEGVLVSHVVRDLARALLQIEQGVEARFMQTPLGSTEDTTKKPTSKKDKTRKAEDEEEEEEEKKGQKSLLERWEESLISCTSIPQIFLHLATFESSIVWSKSALNARCKLCRRKGDAEQMLLCDMCDRGHHMYCLKPPLKKVPQGDWFCPTCKPKTAKPSPRKRRRTFTEVEEDDSSEESEEESSQEEEGDSSTEESSEEEKVPKSRLGKIKLAASKKTDSGRSTPSSLRSRSRGSRQSSPTGFTTRSRSASNKRSKVISPLDSRTRSSRKRPANSSDEEQKPDNRRVSLTKSRGSEKFQKMKHLEDLVVEMTKNEDAAPFLTAVSRRQAPDYYEVIKQPMDLSSIRSNINSYRYEEPLDLIEHIRLMFRNCAQYNQPVAEEFKMGARLAKYFEKCVKQLKLETPPGGQETQQNNKRPRRK